MSNVPMANLCKHRGPLSPIDLPYIVEALEDFYREISSRDPTPNWEKLAQWFDGDGSDNQEGVRNNWGNRINVSGQRALMWITPSEKFTESGVVDLEGSTIDKEQRLALTELSKEMKPGNTLWYQLRKDQPHRLRFLTKLHRCINALRNNNVQSFCEVKNNDAKSIIEPNFSQQLIATMQKLVEALSKSGVQESREKSKIKKKKSSTKTTRPNSKQALIIAEFSNHHKYDGTKEHNTTPIGVTELAEQVGCSKTIISEFFKLVFGGHFKYSVICSDAAVLRNKLRQINGYYKD